jgi:hypothetical protein
MSNYYDHFYYVGFIAPLCRSAVVLDKQTDRIAQTPVADIQDVCFFFGF